MQHDRVVERCRHAGTSVDRVLGCLRVRPTLGNQQAPSSCVASQMWSRPCRQAAEGAGRDKVLRMLVQQLPTQVVHVPVCDSSMDTSAGCAT